MASAKSDKKTAKKNQLPLIPEKYQHFAAISAIFLSLIIFFSEVTFEGKVFVAADNIASKSFQTLLNDAEHDLLQNLLVLFS